MQPDQSESTEEWFSRRRQTSLGQGQKKRPSQTASLAYYGVNKSSEKPSQFVSVPRAMDTRALDSGTRGELEQAMVQVKVDSTARCQVFSPQHERYQTWAFEKTLRQNVFLFQARQHTLLQLGSELPVTSVPLVQGQGQSWQRPPAHPQCHTEGASQCLSHLPSPQLHHPT